LASQTLKAAAVEPMTQASWEEKLAAYVRTSFDATLPDRGPWYGLFLALTGPSIGRIV
jgi:hypothetical protein